MGGPATSAAPALACPPQASADDYISNSRLFALNLQGLAGGDGDNLQEARDAGFYPEAMPRQLMAIFASGDRSERLAQLQTPTLVIHGIQDPLVPVEHGRHTAQVIPGAALREVDGMEHNIPDAVRPQVIEAMLGHLQSH